MAALAPLNLYLQPNFFTVITLNFILPITVKTKLDQLAKQNRKPINETMGYYIDRCLNLKKEMRAERRKEIKEQKEKLIQQHVDKPTSVAKRELNAANDTLNRLQKFINEQLYELCKKTVILEDQLSPYLDSKSQEARIQKKMKDKEVELDSIMKRWTLRKAAKKILKCAFARYKQKRFR